MLNLKVKIAADATKNGILPDKCDQCGQFISAKRLHQRRSSCTNSYIFRFKVLGNDNTSAPLAVERIFLFCVVFHTLKFILNFLTWGCTPPYLKATFMKDTKKSAVDLFRQRRPQSYWQARCATSCTCDHSFVRARRELLETKPPTIQKHATIPVIIRRIFCMF